MKQFKRRKIVIATYGCDPDDVGELWVSWQWVSRLSEIHDVTLLTMYRPGRPKPSKTLPRVRVIEWSELPFFRTFPRFAAQFKPDWIWFYVVSRRWLLRAMKTGQRFDLAHQLFPNAMRYPTPFQGLGVPWVGGPYGGCLETPHEFLPEMSAQPWYTYLRRLDRFRLLYDPWLRRTFMDASVLLGMTPSVRDMLGALVRGKFVVEFDTGIEALKPSINRDPLASPVRFLFVGRLVRSKGALDAIRAFAMVQDLPITLDILGQGYDRKNYEKEVERLGLKDRVRFYGQVPRASVEEFYRKADVFLFPSFQEPSGNVVLEAMSWSLPMIVADRGGPGYVITEECGVRVPVRDPQQYAFDLAAAIRRLAIDPGLRQRLGRAARERVGEIAIWDKKVERMCEIYESVCCRNEAERRSS